MINALKNVFPCVDATRRTSGSVVRCDRARNSFAAPPPGTRDDWPAFSLRGILRALDLELLRGNEKTTPEADKSGCRRFLVHVNGHARKTATAQEMDGLVAGESSAIS